MGIIAKGEITLNTVNDAYTVSLTKSSFVVNADYDGSNPKLDEAYTDITIKRGNDDINFAYSIVGYSSDNITVVGDDEPNVYGSHHTLRLKSIPSDKSNGSISVLLTTNKGYTTTVDISFTVVRESTMLDWIQDWNSNRTMIGSDSVVTPKIFAGSKDNESGAITGVFVGQVSGTAGIYGYKSGIDVFHINGKDAALGGWQINDTTINSKNGNLRLSADGTIAAFSDEGNKVWELNESGSAMFADGNVLLNEDGTASFTGEISSSKGNIGGWAIGASRLSTNNIALDSSNNLLGLYLSPHENAQFKTETQYEGFIKSNGGLYINVKTNSAEFAAYNISGSKLFKINSGQNIDGQTECFVGGWSFDTTGLWIGTKSNVLQTYTKADGDITIGTNGLRGSTWYIDANGKAVFAEGRVILAKGTSCISGWTIDSDSLSSSHVRISSKQNSSGLYACMEGILSDISDDDIKNSITINGGIYLANTTDGCELKAVLSNGYQVFNINSKTASIAGWRFDDEAIYYGTKVIESRSFTTGEDITIAKSGLRGATWYIDANGEAAFAGRKVILTKNTSCISGWTIDSDSLSSSHVRISSDNSSSGLYICTKELFPSMSDSAVKEAILANGGIYLLNTTTDDGCELKAVSSDRKQFFKINSKTASIAGWLFDNEAIYCGTKITTSGEFTEEESDITIAPNGIRSYGWALESDGSGKLANGFISWDDSGSGQLASGNISWDANGNVTFSDKVKVSWGNIDATIIDKNGIFTGCVSADNIKAGTIIGSTVKSSDSNNPAWLLDESGSGQLASGNISWDANGSGQLANGNISWDANGNITFSDDVKLSWQGENSAGQMMANGAMLYRDPEFTIDKTNGTHLYQYDSFDYCTFDIDVSGLKDTLTNVGLVLRGKGTITYVDLLQEDGSISTIWTGSALLGADTQNNLTNGPIIDSNSQLITVRIKVTGEDSYIQVAKYNDKHNAITEWKTILNNSDNNSDSIIGKQYITTKRKIVSDSQAPNSTQKVVQFTNTRWITPTDARLGGFFFANQSRANAKFIIKIVAKIPENWLIENYHNAYGNGGITKWVTSNRGTGQYEEYICMVTCGSSGHSDAFSTINFFALRPKDGWSIGNDVNAWSDGISIKETNNQIKYTKIDWYVAYATVFDATASDRITTTIDRNGIYTGTLRADQIIAGSIDATKIEADVIISNGNAWGLNKDGSGHLANGNISWDSNGNSEFKGEITAASGNIGQFKIDQNGLYQGDPTKWSDNTYKQNLASIVPGTIKLQSQVGYFQAGDVANIKVAIGDHADPDEATNQGGGYCKSAGYFYRQMNDIDNYYYPAVQIISDNVINRDVALLTKGAIVCNGGYVGGGRFLNADTVNVLDLSFGSIQLISNTTQARQVYLPSLSNFKQVFNNDTSSTNALITSLKLISQYNNTYHFVIAFQSNSSSLGFRDYNGNSITYYNKEIPDKKGTAWGNAQCIQMGPGDVLEILLIYDGTNYYAQIMDRNT